MKTYVTSILQSPQCMVSWGGLDWDGSTGSGALTERKPDGLSVDIGQISACGHSGEDQ